ncbi:hypothetical protein [Camelimonas lactis]|uniref:Uncharacterized protein n=1 Tax=Camelimonas lactis TaxID=659006 RepID=A0A4R2GRL1_9HYPH|nr:hypothetical protein [Camelimonas lactis]TCO12446.1 hypothetical protein EV666_10993 [Camelimonas lactis]
MAAVVDNRTLNYDIPLPNAENWLSEDVIRLAQAITAFDQLIKTANDDIGDRSLLGHAHQISEITGLTDVLAQKAAYDHVHALAALSDVDVSIITVGQYLRWNGSKWVPGVVSADDIKAGTIDPARLPSIAITDTYVVASQAAMLGLAVQKGDIAVRTDLNRSFVCSGANPALLASWTELLTPTDAVLSVAGLTGAITASALRTAISTATGIALMTAANAAAARTAIDAAATDHTQDWGTITGKPGSYPPSVHYHDERYAQLSGASFSGNVETSGLYRTYGTNPRYEWLYPGTYRKHISLESNGRLTMINTDSGQWTHTFTPDGNIITSGGVGDLNAQLRARVSQCRFVSYAEQGIGGPGWHGGVAGNAQLVVAVLVSGQMLPGVWGINTLRYAQLQYYNNGNWWNFGT